MQGEHTQRTKGYNIQYWRGNVAAGSEDKWDRAVVSVRLYGQDFTCKDLVELSRLRRLLDEVYRNAFDDGQQDVRMGVRKVLGL